MRRFHPLTFEKFQQLFWVDMNYCKLKNMNKSQMKLKVIRLKVIKHISFTITHRISYLQPTETFDILIY